VLLLYITFAVQIDEQGEGVLVGTLSGGAVAEGVPSSRHKSNTKLIEALNFTTVELDRQDARVASEVRAYLEGQGRPIGTYDNLIAGQALARNLVLVTHNVREFSRVPGLQIEDWEA
jgi:tRNA(fMet)-specific endonuclease VapC